MGPAIMIIGVILMVIIHELAHFLAAKAFNMKATEAFFGFGPRLWSTQRGETEYGVKAIPLGGYVRIIGMNPFEDVAPEDEGRTYRENPFWKKSIVVLAGIVSHFVVAYLLFFSLAVAYGDPVPSTVINNVTEALVVPGEGEGEPVLLEEGDRIVSVAGVPWDQLTPTDVNDGSLVEVVVDRGGTLVTYTTTDSVVPAPAGLIGLQEGDQLVAINGRTFDTWEGFVAITHTLAGERTEITVMRDGETITFDTVLATRILDGEEVGFVGVSPVVELIPVPLASAAGRAASDVAFATKQSAIGLGQLVTNFDSLLGATFGGNEEVLDEVRPISAIGLTRAASSIEVSVGLLAWVNVFVGLLNVIPLYPLDGGHFAVALYEKIVGRAADVRKLLPVAAAVFAFIVLLGILGIYFDIVRPLDLPG